MSEKATLFVYGSFCEGMVHYSRISQYITDKRPAMIRGSAYRLQVGYPVYMADGQDEIVGIAVTLEATNVFFRLLDEFHGYSPLTPEKSLFWKVQVMAELADGSQHDLSVYAINPTKLPKTAKLIEGGAWVDSLRSEPVLTEHLTPRQTEYVKRLGASKGRDIVPIDLDLYRDLMKLDIIVDKGRRLALTKLGKEVYRYLA